MVPPQGTIKLAENKRFPNILAAMWMNQNQKVQMLSSGGSRKRINGEVKYLPAPSFVVDYHSSMGDVGVHDQFQMQRYSVQHVNKSLKYYKTKFLGLWDMATVNAYIVHHHYKNVNIPSIFNFVKNYSSNVLLWIQTSVYRTRGKAMLTKST
ncbi:hypothetical protein PHMEG_00016476 [Phytophthora megakarya]|uniref:PiggyBac transposable element-derived protein domain-containing protein n=1 Tax=Phytophthora megakarya TaxID=4795 RepID=A0A225W0A4_9STRA|nr:hypothetical protein PHMEG_00016476 [Phytophthora megakarya]